MTSPDPPRSHRAVPRLDAARCMLLVLVSFAASVLGTRAFLALTGYPQIGGGTLHIAHALWGGLLLFLAALAALLVAGRAVLGWAAVLTGVGAGLFVDEVGKFITADNDYFFPAAAPIAYAVFLLAVWVYLQVASRRHQDPRTQLHAALDLLSDAVDRGLTDEEAARLHHHLRTAADQDDDVARQRLADALLASLGADAVPVREQDPGRVQRAMSRLGARADRWLTATRLRRGLTVALIALGVLALGDLAVIVAIAVDLRDGTTGGVLTTANEFARVQIEDGSGVLLLLARALLDGVVGVLLLTAATLLLRGRARRASDLAQTALLTSLTVVNLLVFYLEQFAAAVTALVQLALLLAVQRYQRLDDGPPAEDPPERPSADAPEPVRSAHG